MATSSSQCHHVYLSFSGSAEHPLHSPRCSHQSISQDWQHEDKSCKIQMTQEEGEKDTANTGSLQQLLNLSGSNSLGLNTQGGFRTMRTEQLSTYASCDVPATWNSLDSHRFVMLIPPRLLLRFSKGKCCHAGKKKNYSWGWMDVTAAYCSCTAGKALKRTPEKKLKSKKRFCHFSSDLWNTPQMGLSGPDCAFKNMLE